MRTSIKALAAASVLAGTMLAATPAFADETDAPSAITISGSAAIVSQYRFRGISQSDNQPAVQGAITISTEPGFYISTWGSSASAGSSAVDIGGTEIDVYGGYTHGLGSSGVTVDVGVYGYLYPGAPGLNYYEVYGSLAKSFGPVGAKVGIYYAPDQTNVIKANTYVYGELSTAIPNTPITLHSHLGHTGGGFNWTKEYLDYSVGASVSYKNLTFDVSLVGTNVSHDDATASPITTPYETYRAAKSVGVVSLTAAF